MVMMILMIINSDTNNAAVVWCYSANECCDMSVKKFVCLYRNNCKSQHSHLSKKERDRDKVLADNSCTIYIENCKVWAYDG